MDDVLAEQVRYYRARAGEYDEWWERRGHYDDGPGFAVAWQRDIDELRRWVDGAGPLGDVLELAAGTGNWTAELAVRAASVTAVDASPEVLGINAAKVPQDNVERSVADIFTWDPPRRYDTVFFAFWLSHVPDARRSDFFALLDRALAPGGRVLLCDNAHPQHADAHGPVRAWREDRVDREVVTRTLNDGTSYDIVKHYWRPHELAAEVASLGWEAAVAETSFAFIYATLQRAA